MGCSLDSSDSKACLAWDMLDKLEGHQEENEEARKGTYEVETVLENAQAVVGNPREACHLGKGLESN